MTAYAKGDDFPSSEIDVTHLGAGYLASLTGVPASSLTDVYPVDAKKIDELGKRLNSILDAELFDYFVEAEQE
ncbi:hypothetical protein [Streptomyces sp. NBC_01506]|uniref:DUF7683 domain-containing protein n=1 Tax=Streptomyces sp. NBC_01506 TaxID=2903887 RepID=UPI00386FB104